MVVGMAVKQESVAVLVVLVAVSVDSRLPQHNPGVSLSTGKGIQAAIFQQLPILLVLVVAVVVRLVQISQAQDNRGRLVVLDFLVR
jgi:hypothetical protein